jgi:hypothetical protein
LALQGQGSDTPVERQQVPLVAERQRYEMGVGDLAVGYQLRDIDQVGSRDG